MCLRGKKDIGEQRIASSKSEIPNNVFGVLLAYNKNKKLIHVNDNEKKSKPTKAVKNNNVV